MTETDPGARAREEREEKRNHERVFRHGSGQYPVLLLPVSLRRSGKMNAHVAVERYPRGDPCTG